MKKSTLLRRSLVCSAALAALSPSAFAVDYVFAGGNYVAGTTAPEPLAAGDVLNINAGGDKFFSGVLLTNNGSVNWNAGTLYLSSTTVNNHGLWNATSSDTLFYYSGGTPVFNNAGTFRKSAGSGSTSIGGISFVNSGIVDAQVGTIDFNGGSASFFAGTQFTGAGVSAITNNASLSGAFTSANLSLRGGTVTGNAAVMNGTVDFTGGSLAGDWTVASGQQLTMNAGANKFLSGASVVNRGTTTWNGGADNLYMSSSTFDNRGLFDVLGNLTLFYYSGGTPTFVNSGTVRVAGGNTLTVGGVGFVNNGGTLNALAGGTINYAGNNATFNAGTQFTGAGFNVVTANARFVGAFTSQNLVLQSGSFYGGDGVTAGSKAVLNGTVAFTGGTLAGNWEIAAGQTLAMKDGGNKFISGAAVVNKGSVAWQGAAGDNLYFGSSSFDNQALFDAQANVTLLYYSGATPLFSNAAGATVRASGGSTLTVGGVAFVNNGGMLNAQAASTINYNGGNATFNAGTQFTGAGLNVVTASARFVDAFTSQNLLLQGGTFYGGDGATAGSKAVLQGGVAFSGGTLSGNWEIGAGHTLTAMDGSSKSAFSAAIVNKGTLSWQSADAFNLGSSSIDNQGRFELKTNGGLTYFNGQQPTFVNNGLLVKSGGSGTSDLSSIALTNNGTIEVQTGTIALQNGFTNAGTVKGNGAISTSMLTNSGHIAPGSGIATLTLNGNFAQAAGGFLDTELRSLVSTDLFLVTGNAALGGTLALHCFASCHFAVGDQVVILDATGSLSGSFATVTLDGFATGAFNVVYDTANGRVLLDVTQGVTAAVPEADTMALMLAGLGVLGWMARRRRT